jgi:hypothetical protein
MAPKKPKNKKPKGALQSVWSSRSRLHYFGSRAPTVLSCLDPRTERKQADNELLLKITGRVKPSSTFPTKWFVLPAQG